MDNNYPPGFNGKFPWDDEGVMLDFDNAFESTLEWLRENPDEFCPDAKSLYLAMGGRLKTEDDYCDFACIRKDMQLAIDTFDKEDENNIQTETKNMSNKQTIRITESKLEEMVYEAVSKKFKYLMSQASSSLCKDIYNFIDNKELEGVLYTRQDIIDHMMPSFMSKCKKFPSLPKDTLESCVDYMLKKMGKGFNYLNENKNTRVRITEDELKNLVSESVKNVISELDYKTYINAYKKAEKNGDVRAKKFFDAASDEFNKQYGFDDDEGSFYMDDFEHSDGHNIQWDHYPNGDRRYSPDNHHEFDEFSRPAKLRQKRQDLPQRVKQAEREFANYIKGNYNYSKGKGWHLKDK